MEVTNLYRLETFELVLYRYKSFSFKINCVSQYGIHSDDIYEMVFSEPVLNKFSYTGIKQVHLNGMK